MGSRPSWSVRLGAGSTVALVLLATLWVYPAQAQHADAGVEHAAAPGPAPIPPPVEASGAFPKAINPALLSESVRTGLQERAAARHPASLPSLKTDLAHEPGATPNPALPDGVVPPAARHSLGGGEPLRRGLAHMRRVQAVETDEGVTVLSNRIVAPEPRLAELVAPAPRERLHEPPEEPAAAVDNDPTRVTETRSLRPGSSRKLESPGSGLGWLAWPLVLFVTTSAVVGTLWFRKKTE